MKGHGISYNFDDTGTYLTSEPSDEICEILLGEFIFLGEGATHIVFENHKENCVIKFYKTPAALAQMYASWGMDLSTVAWALAPGDRIKSAKLLLAKQVQCAKRLEENPVAHAMLYTHFAQTKKELPEIIIAGIAHNINDVPFVLQQKSDLVGAVLEEAAEVGSEKRIREVFTDIVELVVQEWTKGKVNITMNIPDNYGYMEGRLLCIDLGDYLFTATTPHEVLCLNVAEFIEKTSLWADKLSVESGQKYRRDLIAHAKKLNFLQSAYE